MFKDYADNIKVFTLHCVLALCTNKLQSMYYSNAIFKVFNLHLKLEILLFEGSKMPYIFIELTHNFMLVSLLMR